MGWAGCGRRAVARAVARIRLSNTPPADGPCPFPPVPAEVSPPKLAALSQGVDAWVQIACPRLSIDWGEGFTLPTLNPYEVGAASASPVRRDEGVWHARGGAPERPHCPLQRAPGRIGPTTLAPPPPPPYRPLWRLGRCRGGGRRASLTPWTTMHPTAARGGRHTIGGSRGRRAGLLPRQWRQRRARQRRLRAQWGPQPGRAMVDAC